MIDDERMWKSIYIYIYIYAETLCESVWILTKWCSNFAFSLYFLPLSLSFSILIRPVMVLSIFIFQFSIKKWEYIIWLIHQYFILFYSLFWWSFILFSQPIILRKVCVLEIFLAQSFRRPHYFFKEDLSFEEIV